jgi:DNA-directed RNA polymerase specialized sigma24 family protein
MMIPFQTVLDEHGVALYRHLVGALGPHDGADCYQETLIACLQAWPPSHDANLRGWLFTVAHRKVVDHARAAERRAVPVPHVPGGGPVVDASLDGGDEALWAAVRSLPPKQRAAVALRHADDWGYDEIAAVLDCTEASARQSVKAGLDRLREVLT